jgi:hypothetical protein
VGRFLEPAGYEFRNPNEWARVTSLTVFGGKLFASMGSCTSSHLDAPADFRGKVYALQAGQCVTHDRDLGVGWKHLAAVRRDGRLELYVNGMKTAESPAPSGGPFDVTNGQPLRLGAGETDYFHGKIREVRVHRRALEPDVMERMAAQGHAAAGNGGLTTERMSRFARGAIAPPVPLALSLSP